MKNILRKIAVSRLLLSLNKKRPPRVWRWHRAITVMKQIDIKLASQDRYQGILRICWGHRKALPALDPIDHDGVCRGCAEPADETCLDGLVWSSAGSDKAPQLQISIRADWQQDITLEVKVDQSVLTTSLGGPQLEVVAVVEHIAGLVLHHLAVMNSAIIPLRHLNAERKLIQHSVFADEAVQRHDHKTEDEHLVLTVVELRLAHEPRHLDRAFCRLRRNALSVAVRVLDALISRTAGAADPVKDLRAVFDHTAVEFGRTVLGRAEHLALNLARTEDVVVAMALIADLPAVGPLVGVAAIVRTIRGHVAELAAVRPLAGVGP
ncbi:TPA: hypothetical protein DF272_02905 [Candidatus Falkowbacteria bacterium]|nr:hypothetical protein [Candidatus Falkowbacteria bacterium]